MELMVSRGNRFVENVYHSPRSNGDFNNNALTQASNYINFESELRVIIVVISPLAVDNENTAVSKSVRCVIKIADELLLKMRSGECEQFLFPELLFSLF